MIAICILALHQSPLLRFQDPPGPESESVRVQINLAEEEIVTRGVGSVLANANNDPIRPYPRFREAIKKHANSRPVTMVSPSEPGERLRLTFDLGVPDQLIYAYHTDARGAYGSNGIHISGNSGDDKFARLFAYIRTGPDGKAILHTIRPAGYPNGELPQHVHFRVEPRPAMVDEIWFSDDPRITPAMRDRGRNMALIVSPKKSNGIWEVTAKIALRTQRTLQ